MRREEREGRPRPFRYAEYNISQDASANAGSIPLPSLYLQSNVLMNKSRLGRRSLTIDGDKQNRVRAANQVAGTRPGKRRPKLMPNNRIMQKLFPNFLTLDHERDHSLEPVTFRRLQPEENEERVFRELLDRQRQKYEAILNKHLIAERPLRVEVKEFLGRAKQGGMQTHRC